MNDSHLPATQQPTGNVADDLGAAGLPPSLRILLDAGFYDRVKQLAGVMSKAAGFTPQHLLGHPEACFAIINISLDAKLSPHFVARHTYQTPGGQIGSDGVLIQSILEASGKFIGAPIFEYHGDWTTLIGKFEERTSDKGKKYLKPTWTQKDAVGLGVIVRWFVRGEKVARVWPGEKEPFWLAQCYPLNSPLWATDPKSQIAYLAIRRFANITSPGILGAAAHDYDEILDASEAARDVTPPPRPRPEDFDAPPPPEEETGEILDAATDDIALAVANEMTREQQNPKPAEIVDPEPKPPEVVPIGTVDGAGSSSEIEAGPTSGGGRDGGERPATQRVSVAVKPHQWSRNTVLDEQPTFAVVTQNHVVDPVYDRDGKIAYRAWWSGRFLNRIREAKTAEEFAAYIASNGEIIQGYYNTLAPPALIAAKKEIDDIRNAIIPIR